MEDEKHRYYCELLKKYQEYILCSKEAEPEFLRKLQDEVNDLVQREPEFRKLRREIGIAHYNRIMEFRVASELLAVLAAFPGETPVEMDDEYLELFGLLYQYNSWFREECDMKEDIHDALTSWIEEYDLRCAHDEMFAGRMLLNKLRPFTLGKAGIKEPVILNETECDLLVHLYQNRPEFQKMCKKAKESIREGVAYWIEERLRQTSEKKKP
jgi:hypothetical protein